MQLFPHAFPREHTRQQTGRPVSASTRHAVESAVTGDGNGGRASVAGESERAIVRTSRKDIGATGIEWKREMEFLKVIGCDYWRESIAAKCGEIGFGDANVPAQSRETGRADPRLIAGMPTNLSALTDEAAEA